MGTLIITISQGYKITVIHSLLFEKEVINVPLCCEHRQIHNKLDG